MSTAAKCLPGFVAAASLLLAACNGKTGISADNGSVSAEAGALVVDKGQLSSDVQAQLTQKLGKPVPTVNCPDDLDPDVGATTTCTMTDPTGIYDVTVTVTTVDWTGFGNFGVGNAQFDVKVADKPHGAGN